MANKTNVAGSGTGALKSSARVLPTGHCAYAADVCPSVAKASDMRMVGVVFTRRLRVRDETRRCRAEDGGDDVCERLRTARARSHRPARMTTVPGRWSPGL